MERRDGESAEDAVARLAGDLRKAREKVLHYQREVRTFVSHGRSICDVWCIQVDYVA